MVSPAPRCGHGAGRRPDPPRIWTCTQVVPHRLRNFAGGPGAFGWCRPHLRIAARARAAPADPGNTLPAGRRAGHVTGGHGGDDPPEPHPLAGQSCAATVKCSIKIEPGSGRDRWWQSDVLIQHVRCIRRDQCFTKILRPGRRMARPLCNILISPLACGSAVLVLRRSNGLAQSPGLHQKSPPQIGPHGSKSNPVSSIPYGLPATSTPIVPSNIGRPLAGLKSHVVVAVAWSSDHG
ncbi:hypothetical protein C8D93_101612 [Sinimarinibacterium flocculans]|uniref:Uncharacterized protein n=1 Tax=Sinimarinibacterium flocculans TaxID=985250 RepID=A0A318EI03_9GAMM|nr:hypothetical protein C8D93_101612 [Sinimarinibacterium flocculans]